MGSTRALRKGPKQTERFAVPLVKRKPTSAQVALLEKRRKLFALAKEMGYCLEENRYYVSAAAVAKRLQHRRGQMMHQNTSVTLPGFPRHAAETIFSSTLLEESEERQSKILTWSARTVGQVRLLLGDMLEKQKGFTMGISRWLCTE